jgi:hypothetical protein
MVIVTTLVTPPALKWSLDALTCRLVRECVYEETERLAEGRALRRDRLFLISGPARRGLRDCGVLRKSTLADLGDTTPTQVERTIAIQAPPAEAPPPGTRSATPATNGPMQLNVECRKGRSTSSLASRTVACRWRARFSEALYELTRTDRDAERRVTYDIRFKSKAPCGRGCWQGSATTTTTGRS